MLLEAGVSLGFYRIVGPLGAGGMGEVYRAHDTRLNRDIALKILPADFALNPERLARFKREAQVLASLNHPNIAVIHGFEESDGVNALVLELVDGPTLADRIARGPIAMEEALPIARQIAEALEAAHWQGIIHRDLKPTNIKVRDDGAIKVLDFGLAKVFEPTATANPSVTQSPTITTPAVMTGIGMILGTAAYMSPEQARGRPADKRSDLWAYGCVLYEMLTGTCAFSGDDMADTLATVLKGQPDWNILPTATPSAIRRLLRRTLEKDPKRRLSDMGDARLEIEEALTGGIDLREASLAAAIPPGRAWNRALPWGVAVALAFALVIAVWRPWRLAPIPWSQHLSIDLGANASLRPGAGMALAISPDGRLLAFVGERNGVRQLYLRRLGELQAVPLVTGRVDGPFFSPDSQWVGFFSTTDRKLKRISVNGGTAIPICDLVETIFRGASWGADGYILFNPSPIRGTLLRVSAAGGKPESFSTLNGDEAAHRWPQVLPGARFVLFTAVMTLGGADDARIVVQRLPSGPSKVVLRGGYFGRYLRSGHLVYMQESTLFSVPFDLERLEVTGQPVAIVQGVLSATEGASSWFDVSNEGTLIYAAGERTSNDVLLQWMGRDGATTPMRDVPIDWRNPQFAPDGQHLALGIQEGGQTDLWVYEWATGAMTRLTVDRGQDTSPVWSPDGRSIVFASDRGGDRQLNLYWQSSDRSGDAHRLTESSNNQRPTSWHPSGKYVAFQEVTKDGQANIMILPMESSGGTWKAGAPTIFLSQDKLNAANAMFSADGRWLAYQSNEAGPVEVFVRPFPGPGGRWQVSTSGGQIPTWSRRRSELLFDSLQDNRLMVLSYTADGGAFRASPPQRWSEQAIQLRPGNRPFDLHPDGDRVVVSATREASGMPDKVVLVTNFIDELHRVTTTSR